MEQIRGRGVWGAGAGRGGLTLFCFVHAGRGLLTRGTPRAWGRGGRTVINK